MSSLYHRPLLKIFKRVVKLILSFDMHDCIWQYLEFLCDALLKYQNNYLGLLGTLVYIKAYFNRLLKKILVDPKISQTANDQLAPNLMSLGKLAYQKQDAQTSTLLRLILKIFSVAAQLQGSDFFLKNNCQNFVEVINLIYGILV